LANRVRTNAAPPPILYETGKTRWGCFYLKSIPREAAKRGHLGLGFCNGFALALTLGMGGGRWRLLVIDINKEEIRQTQIQRL
jgi:hypothetical protein